MKIMMLWSAVMILLVTRFGYCVSEDVSGFEIAVGGTNLVKLEHGNTTTINLVYDTGGTGLTFSAAIDTGTNLNTASAVKDENSKTIQYTIDSSLLASDGYGTYLLTFSLAPTSGNTGTKEVVVFYEEPIVGFSINRDTHLIINEEIFFDVTFTSGSNVETEWFLDTNDTCLLKHSGQPRNLKLNFTFTVPGTHNVTVVAANTVTRTFDSMLVNAVYSLNGFNVTTIENAPIATTAEANFVITLSQAASLPMGTLKLNISYGDGQGLTAVELNNKISDMQSASGYILKYIYPVQGNYSPEVVIYSEVDNITFSFNVYIWDKILTSMTSDFIAVVGTSITFQFVDPPPSGFQYVIDYGDGNKKTNNESALYSAYNESSWTYAYQTDGEFNVTMTAWNGFYASVCSYIITTQYPLPTNGITHTPTTDKIPTPDGDITFTITMTENISPPTDVSCTFDFEDEKELNVTTTFTYNVPVLKTYNYSSAGIRTVNFTCWNLVSRVECISTIEVVEFTLADFNIIYPETVAMNTTLSEELDERFPNTSNIMKLQHTTANTTFTIGLLECSKLPPYIIFHWDFGDNTPLESGFVTLTKVHLFQERGTYTVKVVVDNNRTSEKHNLPSFSIIIGVVDFKVTPQRGEISVTDFHYSFGGMQGSVTYTFDPDSNDAYTSTGSTANMKYNNWGLFQASITATNGTITEIVYLKDPVEADYFIEGQLKVSITNGSVSLDKNQLELNLPPGDIEFFVNITNRISKPYIKCTFKLGDYINSFEHFEYGNITETKPLVLREKYYTLGNHSMEINCSNFVSNHYESYYIDVFNHCFTRDGVFDRQYSNRYNAMRAYTSVDTDLSSRMGVICTDKEATFVWKIENVDVSNANETTSPLDYNPPNKPLRGTMRFQRGRIPQGLVKASLNVSLDGTWINEFTYIRFVKPPPFAFINGGNKRSGKFKDKTLEIDAFTDSYDAEKGYGFNQNLNFSWTCQMATAKDLDELQYQFENGHISIRSCDLENISKGKVTLNLTSGTNTQGYIVTVVVNDGNMDSNFTQFIKIQPGDPPNVIVKCNINCREKVSVSSPIMMSANCSDCEPHEKISYVWELFYYPPGTSTPIAVSDFASKTSTGINQASLVINGEKLDEGVKYSLKCLATLQGGNETTEVVVDIVANFAPQPGDRGYCKSNKEVFKTPSERMNVECNYWADEGALGDQDYERDLKNNEPLTYLYETKTWRKNEQNETEIVVAEIYKGGESSLINIPIQVGDENFDYAVEMRVLIFDRFGDNSVFSFNITAKPDENILPSNNTDTSNLEKFFDDYEITLNQTQAGGNDMAVVRLIGSLASVLTPVNDGSDVQEPAEEDIINGNTEFTDPKEESPVKLLFKQKTEQLTTLLSKSVLLDNGEPKQISSSDAQQVSRNLETLFKNKEYVTEESLFHGAKVCDGLVKNVLNITAHVKPFPVEDLRSIEGSLNGTMSTVDKILGILLPETIVDPAVEFTEDTIYAELLQKEINANSDETKNVTVIDEALREELRKKAANLFRLKTYQKAIMDQKQKSSKNSVPKLLSSIESIYTMQLALKEPGSGATTMEKENLHLSVEKVTAETLKNISEKSVRGVRLKFDSNNTDDIDDTIEIKQTVFEKPPQIYGDDVASLTSQAIQVEINNKNIVPEISIPNKGNAQAKRYTPEVRNDAEGMFYIKFTVPNDDDVAFVYLKPDNFDLYERKSSALYDLYLQQTEFPTTTSFTFQHFFSIRDWVEEYGFKVKLPPMKKGKHYLGVKPVKVQSVSLRRRRKRSVSTVGNTTSATPPSTNTSTFEPVKANFSVIIATTGCRSWNENEGKWVSKGCTVLPASTMNETVCRCPESSGNIFATTFYVPPNTIDFNTVFSKFDPSNAAIYGTCIALIVIWIIAAVILRRQDNYDQERWNTYFLCDSDATDEYFYLINVHTGLRRGAGTKSKVNFVLTGEDEDSGVRMLDDGIREGFPSGSVRSFFMGTKESLGDLTYLRVWHDNSGSGNNQSWYLNKVVIDDPQQNQRYVFLCEKWMALDQDDGKVERIIPACGRENLISFNTLFYQHAHFNITENHLWLSLLIRPQRSSFTRVQRASCILALLFLTMISNAMFFRSSSEEVTPSQVQIGMLRFSLSILFISLIGILITTPPILLVTMIFKKCKPKPKTTTNEILKSKMQKAAKSSLTNEQQKKFDDAEMYSTDHLPLPYWTAYIAWVIVVLAVITSTFFLLLYSMQWGKPKSEEWLSSFVFSFCESFIFVDPVKVILIAIVLSIIFKRPADGNSPKLNIDKIHRASQSYNAGSTRTYMTFWNDVLKKDSSPPEEELEKLRQRRQQELRAMEALMNLLTYGLFVFVVFSISYVNRDQKSFLLKNNIDNYLHVHGKGQLGFSYVNGRQVWTEWMNKTFIPIYYPETDYRGTALSSSTKWFGDIDNVRVGPARLRQVRKKKDQCMYSKLTWPYPCVESYNEFDEDESDYCLSWRPYNASECDSNDFRRQYFTGEAWKYVPGKDIWGVSISGRYGTYGGGGYLLKFTRNKETAHSLLNELMKHDWINRGTRAVFVEFTLYNANSNLFIFAQFLAEFTELGGAFNWIESQSFRPVVSIGAMGAYSILCYVVFCIHLIVTTIRMILKMKNIGCKGFLRVAWNVVDLFCVVLSYTLLVMFVFRMNYANKAMKMFYDDQATGDNLYINFQHIVIWDNVFNVVLATVIFIATIRILRILGYNRRFSEVASVISNSAEELMSFGVVFGIIFSAYISLGYLLFGLALKEYRSLFAAWGTLTNALIGKNSLDNLLAVAPQLAQFYYFTYVFCVLLTLATMFAAILNKSISEVRAEAMKEPETFGITNLLTKSFQEVFGISKTTENNQQKIKKYTPIPGKTNFDAPNILRLVRETFGEYADDQDEQLESMTRKMKLSDQDLLLDRGSTSRMGTLSRIDTPGDIHLVVEETQTAIY